MASCGHPELRAPLPALGFGHIPPAPPPSSPSRAEGSVKGAFCHRRPLEARGQSSVPALVPHPISPPLCSHNEQNWFQIHDIFSLIN